MYKIYYIYLYNLYYIYIYIYVYSDVFRYKDRKTRLESATLAFCVLPFLGGGCISASF